MNDLAKFNSQMDSALLIAMVTQGVLFLLGSLALDGGFFLRLLLITAGAYWPIAIMALIRARRKPRRGDLMFVRSGFVFLLPLSLVVCVIVGHFQR
jgi:hypothetical protein